MNPTPKQIKLRKKNEDFIVQAKLIWNDYYDYKLTNYTTAHTKIIIICPKHGQFEIMAYVHVASKNPQGCKQCGLERRKHPQQKTNEKFIKQANEKWGNKYIYANTKYINKTTKIEYECKEHGIISQYPTLHLHSGCPFCNGRGISRHSNKSFVDIASIIHNNKYIYAKTKFLRMNDYVTITCPDHGDFMQRASNHIHLKNGCHKCVSATSKDEKEVLQFIRNNYTEEIRENDRIVLGGKEINIFIPKLNLGIEYNGIYWHLETVRGKKYHYNKWKLAYDKGVQLIQIYDIEWHNKQEIIKSKIMNLLGKSVKVHARKTKLVILDRHQKEQFLTESHVQGSDAAKISYGLEYGGEIVACMTFDGSRFNKHYDWELVRFCNKKFVSVIGGASKLLSHFRKNYKGSIVSYADKRYSNGNLYKALGFKLGGSSKPSFSYFNIKSNTLHSRLSFQKHKLVKMGGYSEDLSEYEVMNLNGYDRIWDCGQYRFILE